jgi:hypothetical protein
VLGESTADSRRRRDTMEQGPDELSDRTMEDMGAGGQEGTRARLEDERRSKAEEGRQDGEEPDLPDLPDSIDEGSEESFPASDPPSETSPAE